MLDLKSFDSEYLRIYKFLLIGGILQQCIAFNWIFSIVILFYNPYDINFFWCDASFFCFFQDHYKTVALNWIW